MKTVFSFWRYFLDGMPYYLARYYWWAYLWRPAIWFFDHQPVINAILFGQYRRLLNRTMACLEGRPPGRVLQLTCVYGKLTPCLLRSLGNTPLHLIDVAPAQLRAALGKIPDPQRARLLPARMNAERLGLRDDAFATLIIFFLLHEMPAEARHRVLRESVRVLRPGGRLVLAEYGREPRTHWVYRFAPLRWLLLRYEPFLASFWRDDLPGMLQAAARLQGKTVEQAGEQTIFDGFYRVMVFSIPQAAGGPGEGRRQGGS